MCRAELLFYYVPSVLLLPVIKRYNCSLDFEKQRFARNILNHQTFERPSLGNLKKGSVPSAFVDCLEKALSRALSSRAQKELNLSSNYTRIPEKVVRKSADGLKYSEQTFASRNLKNNCNVLLRAIKVQKERSKTAARLYT